jgi:hypothetical protein
MYTPTALPCILDWCHIRICLPNRYIQRWAGCIGTSITWLDWITVLFQSIQRSAPSEYQRNCHWKARSTTFTFLGESRGGMQLYMYMFTMVGPVEIRSQLHIQVVGQVIILFRTGKILVYLSKKVNVGPCEGRITSNFSLLHESIIQYSFGCSSVSVYLISRNMYLCVGFHC